MTVFSRDAVRETAAALGFTFCGVVRAEPSPTLDAYLRWIDAGMHGTMGYMARPDRVARRRDLSVILPGARSLVMVGLDYRTASVGADILSDPSRGRIAAYAWGADYHAVLGEKLTQLAGMLTGESPSPPDPLSLASGARGGLSADMTNSPIAQHKFYVDTGAILERSHAQQAGFGFVGKNTMLIHPRRGSTFFIGELITDADFDGYDEPLDSAPSCGTCRRCLNACPTDAFPAPHVLDARKCISALTIEHKGSIPVELRGKFGNWVYGCDVCQDVCPFQRFAPVTPERAFFPVDADRAAPPLALLLSMDEAGFRAFFAGSPVTRIGRDRMVRNACVAAGNSGDASLVATLQRLLGDGDEIVREHARWALEMF